MVSSFVHQVETQPASFASIIFMVLIFLYQYDYAIPADRFAQEYDKQLRDGEWWRVLTSTYSHASMMHLVMNMCSLWYLGVMEQVLGTKTWCRYTLLLVLLTNAVMLGIQAIQRRVRPPAANSGPQWTVGFSGVLFGWLAIEAILLKPTYPLFGLHLPGYVFMFVMLGVAQLILPRVSWQGHLAGIIVGLLIAAPAFEWFGDYLALCTLVWTLIAFVASLKMTGAREFPYIVIQDPQDLERQDMRVVNGEIVYANRPPAAPDDAL